MPQAALNNPDIAASKTLKRHKATIRTFVNQESCDSFQHHCFLNWHKAVSPKHALEHQSILVKKEDIMSISSISRRLPVSTMTNQRENYSVSSAQSKMEASQGNRVSEASSTSKTEIGSDKFVEGSSAQKAKALTQGDDKKTVRSSVQRDLSASSLNCSNGLSSSMASAPGDTPTQARKVARPTYAAKAESQATVNKVDGRTVIDAGDGNDVVSVTQRRNGDVNVSVNGEHHRISASDAANGITIKAGDGDDRVWVSSDVNVNLHIEGGEGNDRLQGGAGNDTIDGGIGNDVIDGQGGNDRLYGRDGNDNISGKGGNDYIEGGAGNDRIRGGDGRDVLYGLDGDDILSGGKGRDYIDGGGDNDTLYGGRGIDQLMGGRGEDTLYGGRGNDVLAGGEGKDRIAGGNGADTVYSQTEDRVGLEKSDTHVNVDLSTTNAAGNKLGENISVSANRYKELPGDPTVAADPDFAMRVQSDLDALRSIPLGREVLTDIDNNAGGHTVSIQQRDGLGNCEIAQHSGGVLNSDRTPNTGASSRIGYDPSRIDLENGEDWGDRPPIVGLFHEMLHSRDDALGITEEKETPNGWLKSDGTPDKTPNFEQTTVGLDYDHDEDEFDASHNPNPSPTPRQNRGGPTENKLRELFNLERRTEY